MRSSRPPLWRRQYLVRSFQYRLIAFQALYFASMGAALYLSAVRPFLETLDSPQVSTSEQVASARALLFLDHSVLPYVIPLAIFLFGHSVLVSHRIAGPLVRFESVLRSMAAGDLSMRVKIRAKDYLHGEARQLDQAVGSLRERLLGLRASARDLSQVVERLELSIDPRAREDLRAARAACVRVEEQLACFRLGPPSCASASVDHEPERRAA